MIFKDQRIAKFKFEAFIFQSSPGYWPTKVGKRNKSMERRQVKELHFHSCSFAIRQIELQLKFEISKKCSFFKLIAKMHLGI